MLFLAPFLTFSRRDWNGFPGRTNKIVMPLQEREITKVGPQKTEKVDIWIIAATNADLMEDIKSKDFREDLYDRPTIVEIDVPPFREGKSDIPLLVEGFMRKYRVE